MHNVTVPHRRRAVNGMQVGLAKGTAILTAIFVAIALVVVLLLRLVPAETDAVADLVEEAGERILREPMRPARGPPRLVVFALDGVGEDEFRQALPRMPRIGSLFGAPLGEGRWERGCQVAEVASVLPSTTLAAWTSAFTGEPPGRTGVPGNEWFERERGLFLAPAPVSVTEIDHLVRMLTDDLVGQSVQVPTIYEQLDRRSYVSLAPVQRGADLFTSPSASQVGELFGAVARGVVDDEPAERERYAEVDSASVRTMLQSIEEHGIPDVLVVYFPGIDLYAHLAPDPLEEIVRYLAEVTDAAAGGILDAYEEAGALEGTWFLFVSDHGHTPVLKDDRHALQVHGAHEPPSMMRAAGFRVWEPTLDSDLAGNDAQVVMAFQGAMAYFYLADRSSCPAEGDPCDWSRPPRLEEDVLALARAFEQVNRTGEGAPLMRGSIDLILARHNPPTDEPAPPFQVFQEGALVPIGEYLDRHPRPELVRFEERMRGLAEGPFGNRAGDVLVLAKSGLERPLEERYYFSERYESWHGSPTAKDSFITFALARVDGDGDAACSLARGVMGDQPSQLHVVEVMKALMEP